MQGTTIAVDLAKSVFEVAVSKRPGKMSERRRLSRGQFSRFLAEQAPGAAAPIGYHVARWARTSD